MISNLWCYRYFIISSIRNEIVCRFARSKLGAVWMVINPLSQVLIYALILSNVLAAKLPGIDNKYAYAIYLMGGLLLWSLFSDIVGRCINVFIDNGNLIKKIKFPTIALPSIILGSCLLNNALLFVCMMFIFSLFGHQFNFVMFWLIPLTFIVLVFAISVGLIIGLMNVFLRDIGQIVPIILQMLFWFTPIVYPVTIIPEAYRHWLNLNPIYPLTNAYQQIIVYGNSPHWEDLTNIVVIILLLFGLSLFLYRRARSELMDIL